MTKKSFTKKLTKSNLNLAGMKDKYITVPKNQVDPEDFFCKPPAEIKFTDKSSKSYFLFPFKKEKNGEHRLSRLRAFFELKKASVNDQVIIRKKTKKDKSTFYEIDLIRCNNGSNVEDEYLFGDEFSLEEESGLPEGAKKQVTVNKFERNKKAREECINYWKHSCSVCKMEFEDTYGEIGKGFIHVHHKIPLSEIGKSYNVDPINDLIPVCPNCHAMIHKRKPNPYTIHDIQERLKK